MVTPAGTPKASGAYNMDLNLLIERKRERFEQLEREIADPRLFDNRKRAGEIMREHAGIKELLASWNKLETARRQLDDNRELATSRDVEIAAMAGWTELGVVPAEAVIDGSEVVVQSKDVASPTQVRFGWRYVAKPNLINKEGLPASPFQTKDWTGGTGE